MRIAAGVSIVLWFVLSGLTLASTVNVTVVDANSREPIEGVKVSVADAEHKLGIRATTDEYGEATLEDLPVGSLQLKFAADGYVQRRYLLTADTIADPFVVRLEPRRKKNSD